MRIHILGIAGTFMAGVAKLAQELGHDVSGSDKNIFPPMDKQLDELGINIIDSTKEYTTIDSTKEYTTIDSIHPHYFSNR